MGSRSHSRGMGHFRVRDGERPYAINLGRGLSSRPASPARGGTAGLSPARAPRDPYQPSSQKCTTPNASRMK